MKPAVPYKKRKTTKENRGTVSSIVEMKLVWAVQC